jgi:pimeloyl-ACP methyl ester carboxylesterase
MKKYRSEKSGQAILETYDRILASWQCGTKERDVETEYGTTHVIECGAEEAPALVLFHGVGDDSALMWIYNAPELSRHFRLYAIDTLGGPGKSRPGEQYGKGFDDVRWIDETLDGLGVGQAFVAGVSHGGYLAQLYAQRRPERVKKAISISGTVPVGGKKSSMLGMMKIFLPEALFPTDKNVIKLLRKLSGEHWKVFTENPDIMEHYKSLLKGFNNMAMGYHKVIGFTPEEVDSIRDRVVYLVGTEDPFEKLGGRTVLENNRMNAVFYEGAGHGLNHELSGEINRKIISILQEAEGA